MSFANQLIERLIVHVESVVSDVTTRNALTEGFVNDNELGSNEFPFCQFFGITVEAVPEDHGQEEAIYDINCRMLRNPSTGEQMHLDIDGIRESVLTDYHLTGLVKRVWLQAYGVDEISSRERTVGAIIFQAQVIR